MGYCTIIGCVSTGVIATCICIGGSLLLIVFSQWLVGQGRMIIKHPHSVLPSVHLCVCSSHFTKVFISHSCMNIYSPKLQIMFMVTKACLSQFCPKFEKQHGRHSRFYPPSRGLNGDIETVSIRTSICLSFFCQ